jgi:hypothetical protein
MYRQWIGLGVAALLGLLLFDRAADAVIVRLTPLKEILDDSSFIVAAKVDLIDAAKLGTVFVADQDLKNKFPVRKLYINLTGDTEAKKDDHTTKMLKRLAPKMTVVLFVLTDKSGDYVILAYTNGTWFQLVAKKTADPELTVFAFTHCEPYLTRTFKGTTDEMKKVVVDGLSGKAKPPPPNTKEPPGLGPEVMPEEKGKEDALPVGRLLQAVDCSADYGLAPPPLRSFRAFQPAGKM